MLIRVHGEATNDSMISMEYLKRLILKFIFEPNMPKAEIHLMEDAFERWNEYLNGMVIESAVGEENKIQLEMMALQLKMKYEGKYKKRIENFKRHKIDYKKFYRLPGAVSEQDILRSNEVLMKWNKKDGREFLN